MQRIIIPYLAGFLAVLFFQQSAAGLLHAAGLSTYDAFSLARVDPFGLPGFIVDAIASGVYAILMAWLLRIDSRYPARWMASFVFGGIVPTAVSIFILGPIQGLWPTGNILPQVAFGFATNAIWGWGTLVLIRALSPTVFMESENDL